MIAIREGLYLGGREDARDLQALREAGITHVLNCAEELPEYHPRQFVYLSLKLKDPDPRFRRQLPRARAFLDDALRSGRALVHCYAGVSRSPSMVLAYLCHRESLTLEEAVRRLAAVAWTAPDLLFLRQIAEDRGETIDEAGLDDLLRVLTGR